MKKLSEKVIRSLQSSSASFLQSLDNGSQCMLQLESLISGVLVLEGCEWMYGRTSPGIAASRFFICFHLEGRE